MTDPMPQDPATKALQAAEDLLRLKVQGEHARLKEFLDAGQRWLQGVRDPQATDSLSDAIAKVAAAREETQDCEARTDAVQAMVTVISRLQNGGSDLTAEEWEALAVAAQRIRAPASDKPPVRNIMDWEGTALPESVLEGPGGGLVYRRQVSILSGAGGAGKSQLALQWMTACAISHAKSGDPVESGGMRCKPARSMYFAYEDEPAWMVHRASGVLSLPHLQEHLTGFPMQKEVLKDRLGLTDMTGRPIYRGKLSNEYPSPTEHWQDLWDIVEAYEASLVVIDPIGKTYRGNGTDLTAVGGFMDDLHTEARRRDVAVLLLGHSTKGGRREKDRDETGMVAGSANWTDSSRSALHLESGKCRKLHVIKTNHGPRRVGLLDAGSEDCWLSESIWHGRFCGFEECGEPLEANAAKNGAASQAAADAADAANAADAADASARTDEDS